MAISCIGIKSLSEYYNEIGKLGRKQMEAGEQTNVLWFRAQSSTAYALLPSLYRNRYKESDEYCTNMHSWEEIRLQHYQAKNYHYFALPPASRSGWIEVMQHHGVSTKALDWSESSTHSLLFALEPFISRSVARLQELNKISPCVWVLEPNALNLEIMRILCGSEQLQKELLEELEFTMNDLTALREKMNDMLKRSKAISYKELYHISNIVNLEKIENEIDKNRVRMKWLLLNGNFNPMYYLLNKVYSEGYSIKNHELPPLAVVQPYHSERIKAQKGVFTIFPFYEAVENGKILNKFQFNPDAMSYHKAVQKHLHKLILVNPQKMAQEALANGMYESWLYPEMPIVSSEIEHRSIYGNSSGRKD